MKNKQNHFVVIITTKGENKNLTKVIDSLDKQTYKTYKIIICSCKKIKNFSNCRIVYSKIKNQVYQKQLAIKNSKISKNDIIIYLDDRITLNKNCLFELNREWNYYNAKDDFIAGIGLSCINYNPPKVNIFHKITLTNCDVFGRILKNGFVSGYGNVNKNIKVDWLNGGMTSWKFNVIKSFLIRNYPLLNWSVGEDLIFSYNISKKYNLIISSKAKCKLLPKPVKKNFKDNFLIGFYHSYITNSFIRANKDNFSLTLFYYSILTSSIIGIIKNCIYLNFSDLSRFLGRLAGSLKYYKNIR